MVLVAAACVGAVGAHAEAAHEPSQERESQTGAVLAAFDLDESPDFRERLPGGLDEISGLAITADGTLLAHDDERARIYELDAQTAEVLRRYELGDGGIRADYEGIAVIDDVRFLVTSQGTFFRFRDGADRGNVPFEAKVTELRRRCEVEGLATKGRELLVACKQSYRELESDQTVVYGFDTDRMELDTVPRYTVSWDAVRAAGGPRRFFASGIEVHPGTGHLVLIAARQGALLELDGRGRLVAALRFDEDRHPQSEGIALTADGSLYIADEGSGGDARLTRYVPTP